MQTHTKLEQYSVNSSEMQRLVCSGMICYAVCCTCMSVLGVSFLVSVQFFFLTALWQTCSNTLHDDCKTFLLAVSSKQKMLRADLKMQVVCMSSR